MSQGAFIEAIAPAAIHRRLEGSVLFASVRIAQSMLETGGVLHSWNNLVGLKVGTGIVNQFWHGSYVTKNTWEVVSGVRYDGVSANFRAYDSIEDGYGDQDLLLQSPRYAAVRTAGTPQEQARALVSGGYATDPQYAEKLSNLITVYGLMSYDEEVKQMLQQWKEEIEALKADVAALKEQAALKDIPIWAQDAVNEAVKEGIVLDPTGGSYDFYRILAVLHRKGLL